MSDLLIVNARLLDPATRLDRPGSLLIRAGLIADLGTVGAPEGMPVWDAGGAALCPGLVDMRATLGEPGFEHRETVASAAEAASAGGITTLAALPDSRPATDDPALVRHLRARGQETGRIDIAPYGALTRGCAGEDMAEFFLLHEAGAVAFTDGRRALANPRLMRLALRYLTGFGGLIVQHPEEPTLSAGGCATEGELATRMGLPGIPAAAEAIQVARDIRLCELAGGRLHFASISTAEALDLIRAAKRRGVAVTASTAPPYFDLNETALSGYRTFAKLSPPLRAEADRQAVAAALADGTLDAVASDHMPLDPDDKSLPYAQAAAGGTGLATLLAVTLAQAHNGTLTLLDALALLTHRPADLLGLRAGRLAVGAPADLCLFAPERAWQIRRGTLAGKAQNTPFDGRPVEGRVLATFKSGRQVFG